MLQQENRAVARKPRDTAAVLFGLKFADNAHCKFKSSQASKVRLQSSKHTGAKQNLTQNGHSKSFKVTRFGVNGEAIKEQVMLNTNVGLIEDLHAGSNFRQTILCGAILGV